MTRDEARRLQGARRWHRRVALVVALWLALLALTGSAINRAHDWGLDRASLPAPMQRALYGIDADGAGPCARLQPAPEDCAQAFTRLDTGAGSILLTPHRAVLLDSAGQPVEALPAGQLGLARIDGGLAANGRVYLRGGTRVVAGDAELLEVGEAAPEDLRELPESAWRQGGEPAQAITWERLLLDLHAARFLGPAGPWVTDGMAALILFLVVSGLRLYGARRRSGER